MSAIREIQREHAARRFGPPMVGDPVFHDDGGDGLLTRRACQYAAAQLYRAGALVGAETCAARFDARLRVVVFSRAGEIVAVYRIPDRVMDFDPGAPAMQEIVA